MKKIEFTYDFSKISFDTIFHNVLEKYVWDILEDEVHLNDDIAQLTSPASGTDLINILEKSHNIVFLNLRGYNDDQNFETIDTYDDFERGECKIIILIADCNFVEIYLKNEEDLNTISSKLKKFDISYDYLENRELDGRYVMYVNPIIDDLEG